VILVTDVLIIGGGPAGVTAGIYTARANFNTLIICKDQGALGKAEAVENFYGHLEISGAQLVETGLEQVRRAGADVMSGEVVSLFLAEDGNLQAQTADGRDFEAKTALIATGATRTTPKIKGLSALEGRGVSYCAVCDGFFYRGKDVAVLGSGAYALHEVEDLLPLAAGVTVLTNGEDVSANFPKGVDIRTEKIKEVITAESMIGSILKGVLFESGEELLFSGLFVAVGTAGASDLARKIGAVADNRSIVVDNTCRTSIPGLWAAGDCTGGVHQIAKAVYEGMEAGMDIVKFLRQASSGESTP